MWFSSLFDACLADFCFCVIYFGILLLLNVRVDALTWTGTLIIDGGIRSTGEKLRVDRGKRSKIRQVFVLRLQI